MGRIVIIAGEKWYVGLDAIAARLGYKCMFTIRTKILKEGLLAFRGHLPGAIRRGQSWCISESLISAWYRGRAAMSREMIKKQRIATHDQRRYEKRHADRQRERDTRAAVGPNGTGPLAPPATPHSDSEEKPE